MSSSKSPLFDARSFAGIHLRNRFAVSPMARVSASEDGIPTAVMRDYYQGYAKGGFGLIFTESLYMDMAFSQGYPFQPGMVNAAHAQGWKAVTGAVHAEGAAMFAQLMHAGALAQGARSMAGTIAPSAVRPKGQQMAVYYGNGEYLVPGEISEQQMLDVIEAFADAAGRAVESAGFDGIEIHGANGYLFDEFLSEGINLRRDRWGGPMSNRVAFLVEALRAVKARLAGRAPVGVRISQGKVNDFHHKWSGGQADAEVIFGSLAQAGADFIHVTEFEAWQPAFAARSATLASLARRYAPDVPLIVNGGLHDMSKAELAVRDGADLVSIGRGALANPDLPLRFHDEQPLREFDSRILGPIANIKESELALRRGPL